MKLEKTHDSFTASCESDQAVMLSVEWITSGFAEEMEVPNVQDAGHNAWLRVRNGGHSGVASRREYARGMAESLGFGLRHLESAGTFSAKVVSVSHQE